MTKISLIRLPDWAGEEIGKLAVKKGLPFATVTKSIVCEYLKDNAPVTACQHATDAANTPTKEALA